MTLSMISDCLLPLLMLLLQIPLGETSNHFCVVRRWTETLQLSYLNDDERIHFPEASIERGMCKMIIRVQTTEDDSLVVLMGVPPELVEHDYPVSGTVELRVTKKSGSTISMPLGTIMTLAKSELPLEVRANWDPKLQPRDPAVNLRVMLPVPGFCSWDMLSFHVNCHAVSPVHENFTVAMSRLRGSAQLATFISMSQLNDFIAANEARLDEFPFVRPLDLSRPVRIGLFYNASDGRILSLVRRESGCELRPVETPAEMTQLMASATGACASLRAEDASGRPVVEFGDCNAPMPALISFPETASSAALDCSDDLVQRVKELGAIRFPIRTASERFESRIMSVLTPTSTSMDNQTFGGAQAIVLCVSILLGATAIIFAAVCCKVSLIYMYRKLTGSSPIPNTSI